MKLNETALKHAQQLIEQGKYIMDSDWSKAQPTAAEENEVIAEGWDVYGRWFLGIATDESPETKARFTFPYGDFRRVHRDGLIAVKQRAAQHHHRSIEEAADELLDMIDKREQAKRRAG
jgi:hypothetical protein